MFDISLNTCVRRKSKNISEREHTISKWNAKTHVHSYIYVRIINTVLTRSPKSSPNRKCSPYESSLDVSYTRTHDIIILPPLIRRATNPNKCFSDSSIGRPLGQVKSKIKRRKKHRFGRKLHQWQKNKTIKRISRGSTCGISINHCVIKVLKYK